MWNPLAPFGFVDLFVGLEQPALTVGAQAVEDSGEVMVDEGVLGQSADVALGLYYRAMVVVLEHA